MAKPRKITTNDGPTPAPGITKRYLKTRPVCKVTFRLPKEAAPHAQSVCIMGEFNDWSLDATPMKRRADGQFSVTIDLPTGRSYRFRYVIDGSTFENDWAADRYEQNPYGEEDSVVDV
ncbi:MAG: isoamylase early set domain-containing protein [Thermoleophilia bacterium]|jgi:1,4-alpha-glucan branching enzyme